MDRQNESNLHALTHQIIKWLYIESDFAMLELFYGLYLNFFLVITISMRSLRINNVDLARIFLTSASLL